MPTNSELHTLVQHYIQGVLAEHKRDFADYVSTGVTPEMSTDTVCGIMIGNSLTLCVQLSVQITMSILSDLGVVPLTPAPQTEKAPASIFNLHIIEGGLADLSPDKATDT